MRDLVAEQPALLGAVPDVPPPPILAPALRPRLGEPAAAGVDLILEGFLQHHGRGRLLILGDPGRRVLAGDYCYAQGLVQVASAAPIGVVEALADLVALSAALRAQGRRDQVTDLWRATVHAIARGEESRELRAATAALRDGDAGPVRALAAAAPDVPSLADALAG